MKTVFLTAETATRILRGETSVSLDLGLSTTRITLSDDQAVFENGNRVSLEILHSITKRGNVVFSLLDSKPYPVELRNGHYYKLVPTSGAPTLEIDGIRMHRSSRTEPETDAKKKVEILGVHSGLVLEIGTGLGYTAKAALDAGADEVVSIELNPLVLMLAGTNPWSHEVFRDKKMHIIVGDAYCTVACLPLSLFDYIIHDPPSISLAGQLYGSEFYASLFGVIRPGGKLLHYIGEPGSKYRGLNLKSGVVNRLRQVGFAGFRYDETTKAVTCKKPR